MAKNTTGTVGLSQLRVPCTIGCSPEERTAPRELLIDVRLTLPFPNADRLDDTVDYTAVAQCLCEVAAARPYHLLEALAPLLVHELLRRFPLIHTAWIRIAKPHPIATCDHSFVEYEASHA